MGGSDPNAGGAGGRGVGRPMDAEGSQRGEVLGLADGARYRRDPVVITGNHGAGSGGDTDPTPSEGA